MLQEFLKAALPYLVPIEVLPSSSPDLYPCDHQMWGAVEVKSNASPHNTITSLECSIKRELISIKPDEARIDTCASFGRRITVVNDTNGGHIERN